MFNMVFHGYCCTSVDLINRHEVISTFVNCLFDVIKRNLMDYQEARVGNQIHRFALCHGPFCVAVFGAASRVVWGVTGGSTVAWGQGSP